VWTNTKWQNLRLLPSAHGDSSAIFGGWILSKACSYNNAAMEARVHLKLVQSVTEWWKREQNRSAQPAKEGWTYGATD
jgi:hypothetical protein